MSLRLPVPGWSLIAALAVIAATALAMNASPRGSQAGALDLEGVTCIDLHLDQNPAATKGDPPGAEDPRVGKILSRIDPGASPGDWDITSVAYTGPDLDNNLIPDKPPSADPCTTKGDGNSLNSSIDPAVVDINDRPTATGQVVTKGADENLEWSVCQFQADLLGGMWVLNEFSLVLDGDPNTTDYGILTAYLDSGSCTTSASLVFNTVLVSENRDVTTGEPSPSLDDDWDGDGCSDWDELAVTDPVGRDPFVPDCAVGGIAAMPDVDTLPAATSDGGSGAFALAAVGGGVLGLAVLLGAGVYARRRLTG